MNAALAQVAASDPKASVFVAANAGSGKTLTLVKRVARLLLAGASPAAILCVTYTKAGAAEMQRRLFQMLGDWAVMADALLSQTLTDLGEPDRDLSRARSLFASALETPGGLKIQTIHAFCEKLLKRFPLEAGISPGFSVLEDAAAADASHKVREGIARVAMANPTGDIGRAYNRLSIELDYRRFHDLMDTLEARLPAIEAFIETSEESGGVEAAIWTLCGFDTPSSSQALQAECVARTRWLSWKRAAEVLAATARTSNGDLAAGLRRAIASETFADIRAPFFTKGGAPRWNLGTTSVDTAIREWLAQEQKRIVEVCETVKAAVVAEDTLDVLAIGQAYSQLYGGLKRERRALDFRDLIARTHDLLTGKAGAAVWVLYKLDGGIDHVLLDEAQDTAPDQWDILRTLTSEFFVGLGAGPSRRTMFAVGDEKQSIFSFQGAAPERMALEKHAFRSMVEQASQGFRDVQLHESWRSTPEVLEFVDTVFGENEPEALAGLRPAKDGAILSFPLKHTARRLPGGCVELWPLEVTQESEEVDPWAPVDAEPPESANKKLARRIAGAIKAMVERGDAVGERNGPPGAPRPCAWGDVLILVRRRGALFHEIIRALKREGVPVGGADRLKLSEHVVFQDLMALGEFARYPADDLTLAALLRSPMCEVDEDSLFALAWNRPGSLWAALNERGDERPEWRTALEGLAWARLEAGRRPPFDFYSRLLARLDGEGRSMRQRMLTRLGAEAQDALDAFLAEALAAEGRDVRDLETFLFEMAGSDIEVKREQQDIDTPTGGEVRVMTVHGAKGLEAPIVILPDTTTRASAQGAPLLDAPGGGFLWAPRKADDCKASSEARRARDIASEQESLRLLYVALTRARDRLIVCGVQSQKARFERSWRDYVDRAFHKLGGRPFALDGGPGEGLRYGRDPAPAQAIGARGPAQPPLPPWVRSAAPTEAAARYVAPSGLGEEAKTPAPSPLSAVEGLGRFRRGDLIHFLLQVLPDLPAETRATAARRMLQRERDLTEEQRQEMVAAALGVLIDERFAAVFGPGSKPEVALAGAAARLPRGLAISGRVDRLLVEPDRVLVVDFKTNRPSPERIEMADPAYIIQMAVYVAVLAEIFPGRRIEAALVWTDGPKLMPVPEKLMLKALDEIAANG